MTKNIIPAIGTCVPISEVLGLGRDGKTAFARIRFDECAETWSMVPVDSSGLLSFLIDNPHAHHTHIRITSIQPTGTAVYAEPISSK